MYNINFHTHIVMMPTTIENFDIHRVAEYPTMSIFLSLNTIQMIQHISVLYYTKAIQNEKNKLNIIKAEL